MTAAGDAARWRGEIVGHRGAAGLAPENTISSFDAALAAGAEAVELDVRCSADGVAMVFHDARLGRFLPGADLERPVFRRTAADLARIDVGKPLGRPRCFIPTLSDVLHHVGARVPIHVELKGSGVEGLAALRAALAAIRGQAGVEAILSSFHEPIVRAALETAPDLPRALIADARSRGDVVAAAAGLCCVALHASAEISTPDLAARCRARNLAWRVWTVNDEPAMERFMGLGVDALITDFPDRLARLSGRAR